MTGILQLVKNRLFSKNLEPSHFTIEEDSTLSSESRYSHWIQRKIRRECFFDGSNKLSHWVPYLLCQTPLSIDEQRLHTWSPVNKSDNLIIYVEDPFTIHRNPVSHSTDVARGKQGYSTGVHIWKVTWPVNERGTHAVIGVSTSKGELHFNEYVSLLGRDEESWGWDITNMITVHNMANSPLASRPYPEQRHLEDRHKVPETIFVILDMFKGNLSYFISNKFLGIAHTGLLGKTLYPAVSAVWGHCQIKLNYYYSISASPPSLLDLSLYVAKKLLKYHCQYSKRQYHTWFSKQFERSSKLSSSIYVISGLKVPNSIKYLLAVKQNS